MLSFEREIRELQGAGVLDQAGAERALARDRGTAFSLFEPLRVLLWASVALIVTGVGLWLKDHLDRIGPVLITTVLALVAALCYATAIRTRVRAQERTLGGDYLLLLGALLLSADVGYAESQFHWLGANATLHLLLLALFHGACAWWFDSRLLLSVALTSLAAWFGLDTRLGNLRDATRLPVELGGRALTCAAVVFVLRALNFRDGRRLQFQPVLEHAAMNLAFCGALAWCYSDSRLYVGLLVVALLAWLSLTRGYRLREESFLVYGVGYPAIALGLVIDRWLDDRLLERSAGLVLLVAAAAALWKVHQRMRKMS